MTDKNNHPLTTKILWSTQFFAPTHYPIELVAGESFWFFDERGDDRVGFYARAGGGWRNGAVDAIGGSPSSPAVLPYGVKLMWLSFMEARFYHVVILLPQQEIYELAGQTLTTHERVIKNHVNIQFAIAPQGFVSLRAGFGHHMQELITKEAEVANADWTFFAITNHFDPSMISMSEYIARHLDKVPPTILQNAKQGRLPTHWQKYSTHKFLWHIVSDVNLIAYYLGYVNGEIASYTQQSPKDSSFPSPAPAWLSLFYKQNGIRYEAIIHLSHHKAGTTEQPTDDVDIFEGFVKFFGNAHGVAALVIQLNQTPTHIFLTNGHHNEPIDACIHIKTLDTDDYPWFV